jgi:ATP-binding cassette subfamily B multidrug efflux pump
MVEFSFLRKPFQQMGEVSFSSNILLNALRYRPGARFVMLGLAFLATVCGLLVPFFQREFVNHIAEIGAWPAVWWMAGVFVAGVGQQGLNASFRLLGNREGLLIQKSLSQELYQKSIHLLPEARARYTVGEMVNYYAQDIPTVATFVEEFFPAALITILSFLCAPIVAALFLKIPMTQVLFVTGVSVSLSIWFGNRQARFFILNKQHAQERMGIVNEWLQNMRIVRILGSTERFERKITAAREVETRNRLSMVTNGSAMNSIAQVTPFVINVAGVFALVKQHGASVTPGDVFAVLWVFGVFFMRPLRIFPFLIANWHDARTSAARLERFLALPQEEADKPANSAVGEGVALSVCNLNLRIGERHLLKDVSLDIAAGQFVVIVGEVGCGKSLLLQSLMRMMPASFDVYELGGISVENFSLGMLRSHFGYVSQDGFVMSASLRDNISLEYDTHSGSDSSIFRMLTSAEFRLDEERMPHGLHTEIGERGVNLSGGQKQRVNLARCGYFDRPVLLLDDCLSAVDVETERLLVQNLFLGAWKNKTRILVTHRLSVLPHADTVVLMENGQIVETGSYSSLLEKSARMQNYVRAHEKQKEHGAHGASVGGDL